MRRSMIKRPPIELPPEVARRFFEDMRAFHRERKRFPYRSELSTRREPEEGRPNAAPLICIKTNLA